MNNLVFRIWAWLSQAHGLESARRSGARTRPYIERHIAEPPHPNVISGPMPLVRPSNLADSAPSPSPIDIAPVRPPAACRLRARSGASRHGRTVLIAVARQTEARQAAAA